MGNVLKADLLRVVRKKSFNIINIIQILIIVGVAILAHFFPAESEVESFKMYTSMALSLAPLVVGIPVFLAVFSDDFRSRAMQTAIGHGTSRSRLIRCRFFELLVVVVSAFLAFSVVIIIMAVVMKHGWKESLPVLKELWVNALATICWCAIAMIFVYAMQKATLALVMYILLALGTISMILSGISLAVPFLRDHKIDLSKYTVSGMITMAQEGGTLSFIWWAVLVAAYIVLPLWITATIFRKKELEF